MQTTGVVSYDLAASQPRNSINIWISLGHQTNHYSKKKKKKRVLEASSSIFYNLLSHFLLCTHKFLQKFLNWLFELFALFYR